MTINYCAVSNYVNGRVTGREKYFGKRCKSNSKSLGEPHEEWTEAGVGVFGKGATAVAFLTSNYSWTRDLRRGGKEKKKNWSVAQWSKVLSSFVSQSPGVWRKRHRSQCVWSPVWHFSSVRWVGMPCHLLVLAAPPGFIKSKVNAVSTRGNSSASHVHLVSSVMEMLISTDLKCHNLIASPRHTDAAIHSNGAPTKEWVYTRRYFSEAGYFCIWMPLFISLRKYSISLTYWISDFCEL